MSARELMSLGMVAPDEQFERAFVASLRPRAAKQVPGQHEARRPAA